MRTWPAFLFLAWSALAGAETWRFAVMGDTPYSERERREFPLMLESVAEAQVDLAVHIGDIKGGKDRCDDSLFEDRKALFNAFKGAFVFVPGDNEWSDCDRVSNGSFEPLERLGKLRSLFWSDGRSLGQRPITLERQPGAYPEHSRFRLGPVLVVTLNVPGPDNNWGMVDKPRPEFVARNEVVLDWLKDSFALARREKLAGVVLLMQANPDFGSFARGLADRGFRDLLETLRNETLAFPGQVLLVHGDTHHHQINRPLRDRQGTPIERFTRIETYGYPFMGWAKVYIDTDSPGLFRFESHPWPPRSR